MQVVGSGRTSSVFKCLSQASSADESFVAIKCIRNKAKAFEEINRLMMLGHPNVVSVSDVMETDEYVGIVMPLMRMDLRSFLHRVRYHSAAMLRIQIQTTRAVHHIHTRGMVHMDIKPENICVDFSPSHDNIEDEDAGLTVHCKLVDFGSSLIVRGATRQQVCQQTDNIASPTNVATVLIIQTTKGYQPPELLSTHGLISFAGDIYSLGVVFHELNHGLGPAAFHTSNQLSSDMRQVDFRQRPSSLEVLRRLGDSYATLPILRMSSLVASPVPIWASPFTSMMLLDARRRKECVAAVFVNDHSDDLQRLVTLACTSSSHHQDAFWMLHEASVDEVSDRRGNELSVVTVLPYFEARLPATGICALFYAKSIDILSQMPDFNLSEDTRANIQMLSISSRSCERPLIRCLSNCWTATLREWCMAGERQWGARSEQFHVFVSRFTDDWDSACAAAARILAGR